MDMRWYPLSLLLLVPTITYANHAITPAEVPSMLQAYRVLATRHGLALELSDNLEGIRNKHGKLPDTLVASALAHHFVQALGAKDLTLQCASDPSFNQFLSLYLGNLNYLKGYAMAPDGIDIQGVLAMRKVLAKYPQADWRYLTAIGSAWGHKGHDSRLSDVDPVQRYEWLLKQKFNVPLWQLCVIASHTLQDKLILDTTKDLSSLPMDDLNRKLISGIPAIKVNDSIAWYQGGWQGTVDGTPSRLLTTSIFGNPDMAYVRMATDSMSDDSTLLQLRINNAIVSALWSTLGNSDLARSWASAALEINARDLPTWEHLLSLEASEPLQGRELLARVNRQAGQGLSVFMDISTKLSKLIPTLQETDKLRSVQAYIDAVRYTKQYDRLIAEFTKLETPEKLLAATYTLQQYLTGETTAEICTRITQALGGHFLNWYNSDAKLLIAETSALKGITAPTLTLPLASLSREWDFVTASTTDTTNLILPQVQGVRHPYAFTTDSAHILPTVNLLTKDEATLSYSEPFQGKLLLNVVGDSPLALLIVDDSGDILAKDVVQKGNLSINITKPTKNLTVKVRSTGSSGLRSILSTK